MTAAARNIDRNRQARTPAQPGAVSLSIRVLGPLLGYIKSRGHDTSAFLRDQGVDPELLGDPESRLPQAIATRLWLAAGELTRDSNLGIHVAEGIQPGTLGALGYALRTSETLSMSFQRLCRYHRLLHDVAEVKLALQRDRAVLSHYLPIPRGPVRPISEYVLTGWLLFSHQSTGVHWTPLEVRFPHPQPDDTSELRRLFGCTMTRVFDVMASSILVTSTTAIWLQNINSRTENSTLAHIVRKRRRGRTEPCRSSSSPFFLR